MSFYVPACQRQTLNYCSCSENENDANESIVLDFDTKSCIILDQVATFGI